MVEQVELVGQPLPTLNLRRDERGDIELQLLLDALLRYGSCDFRFFNQSVLRRRVADALRSEGLETISALQERVLHSDRAFASFVVAMSGGTSTLFADPPALRAFRDNVIPLLRTYSFIRVWVPGAGTGGDAYSLAALFKEARILDRTVIYATFFNDATVAVAKAGLYRHDKRARMEGAAKLAGLESPACAYFDIDEAFAVPNQRLRDSVLLGRHNPATDGSINEFHAIVSRGVLPLLNGASQFRAHALFFESLVRLGFLSLGSSENIVKTAHEGAFRQVTAEQPIFRRLR
ncbi:MAG TPA: CheR family methyltransferase [Candidatus Aquilonibacter sp.]